MGLDYFRATSTSSDMYGRQAFEDVGAIYNQVSSDINAINQLQMEREDSAYQRMVADMKKAGLNPWLGVSSGGSASSPLQSPSSAGYDKALQALTILNKAVGDRDDASLKAIQTGLKVIMPLLALFGA